ncbi:hypothetical protein P344_01515 [Spiroplasma mirum ATCC 29335]|uniref:Uncharacterized protein n=1 Tax=Spiroplasma mirum ATCC 29335 TaxID=838561 RepID=W6AK47_9MOLU|nr:hypothetical protein P344_01515 [Spiroplasma mirum ATCC 29335]
MVVILIQMIGLILTEKPLPKTYAKTTLVQDVIELKIRELI